MKTPVQPFLLLTALLGAAAICAFAATAPLTAHQQLARDIYRELIEINTVTATGDTAQAADAMAARLRAAGLPATDVQVFKPAPKKGNLVARLRGTGARKPIILLAHLDVVDARREDWSFDPFKLTEQDGFFYGRGTTDVKHMAAGFVATRVEAGHANNALPQTARALVNCRVLPGEPVEAVRETIIRVLADDQIAVTPVEPAIPSPPSPLHPQVFGAVEKLTAEFWPGTPVIPMMETGGTDGLFLRNAGIPTYGVGGCGTALFDVRAHGKDERMPVKSFYEGLGFSFRLVKALSGGA